MSRTIGEIRTNLDLVRAKIDKAARLSGRKSEEIRVIVVSKSQPLERIKAAINAGVRVFGENYPQEAIGKIEAFPGCNLEWHMIGHLQSRKVRIIAEQFHFFHALDRFEVAVKLNSQLSEMEKFLPTLIEVNLGGELTKTGWRIDTDAQRETFASDIDRISQLKYLRLCGLMVMPPYSENPEESRQYFREMHLLKEELTQQFRNMDWSELSMGTSLDYEVAVEEGATMVRIGKAILGPRPGK